jgi:DMSO reductase family type II enzyme chaperone
VAAIAAREKVETTGEAGAAAEARSRLYLLLSGAVSFPEREFHSQVTTGAWARELASLCAQLPYRLNPGSEGRWRGPSDYDAFQSEYIRLFEVGARGRAPCPLYSGHHSPDRMRTMEELVRFYNFFGLKIAPGHMPDHASVELEFMHYLAARQEEEGEDRTSYLLAQRDFLDRQLLNWWPRLATALKRERTVSFYKSLAAFGLQFLQADRKYLGRAVLDSA